MNANFQNNSEAEAWKKFLGFYSNLAKTLAPTQVRLACSNGLLRSARKANGTERLGILAHRALLASKQR